MSNKKRRDNFTSCVGKVVALIQSKYGFLFILLTSLLMMFKSYFSYNPIIELPVDSQFGLLNVIPFEYWIALLLSFLLMTINIWNKKKGFFFMSFLLFTFIFVNMESVFFYSPVGSDDAYGHFMRGVNLLDASNPLFQWGHELYGYFGSFIFTKTACTVIGLQNSEVVPILSIFKMIVPLIFFSLVYYLIKKFTTVAKARVIAILMILSNPYFQFHYSPQAFGLLLLPIFILLVVVPRENTKKYYILQIIIFVLLMFIHGPTTMYLAMTYFFVAGMHALLKLQNSNVCKINTNLTLAIIFLIGAIIANPTIFVVISNVISELGITSPVSNFAQLLGQNAGLMINGIEHTGQISAIGLGRVGGNYLVAESVRIYVLGIASIIYAYGTFQIIRKKKFDSMNLFLMGAFLSAFIFLLGNVFNASMNLVDRAFLFIVFGAILMLRNILPDDFAYYKNIHFQKHLSKDMIISFVLLFILLSPGLNIVTHSYNEGIFFSGPQNRDRYTFIMDHSDSAIIYSYRDNSGIFFEGDTLEQQTFSNKIFRNLKYFINRNADNLSSEGDDYVMISEATVWSYHLQDSEATLEVIVSYCNDNMNKIYSSPGNEVWRE